MHFKVSICDICERPLTSIHSMLRHRDTHKSVEERLIKCNICNKVMLHAHSLRYHMKSHETSKPFICDLCGMGFATSWRVKNHRKTHNTELDFRCDQCPKAYTTYTTLYLHIKAKHKQEEKDESVQCNICGKIVGSKVMLLYLGS
jgi:phage FluMu protein Com